ncbi:SapC family protein [Colwellia sp. MEBiC06753]
MANIQVLSSITHKTTKIKDNPTLEQSKHRHFAPVVLQEFVPASQEFPVVFVKNAETGQFKAIALLGLKPEQNLFYSPEKWLAGYQPETLALYPFLLGQNDQQNVLCIDQDSPLINDSEGHALFDEQGNQSDWLAQTGERVIQHVEKSQMTDQFIQLLLAHDLLAPQSLTLNIDGGESYALNGLYVIDEAKLNALSNEVFCQLREKGVLPAIYASMLSMHRVHNLIKLAMAQ